MNARDHVLVHYHEIGLKGRNRSMFERQLIDNIVRAAGDLGAVRPRRLPGRIVVPVPDGMVARELADRFSRVFGVANVAPVRGGTLDFEQLCELAGRMVDEQRFETFAVRARTAHSDFPLSGREINEKLGAWLLEHSGARVNLSEPDLTCRVEIVGDLVLVGVERIPGAGGLPVGVSGRVAVLLSSGIDSPVAAARMMRRGARCTFVHFHSQPYTDGSSVRNVRELTEQLTRLQYDSTLFLVPLAPAQRVIATECPEDLRTVLYRRMMMRIAERLAQADGAKALVTGDSLGQVASQTLENLAAVGSVASMPVLRPLIGLDKTEIIDASQSLGLFEASSAPCQEACVLFEPKKPATKARSIDCERAERTLDLEAMITAAVEAVEAVRFSARTSAEEDGSG